MLRRGTVPSTHVLSAQAQIHRAERPVLARGRWNEHPERYCDILYTLFGTPLTPPSPDVHKRLEQIKLDHFLGSEFIVGSGASKAEKRFHSVQCNAISVS